MNKFAKYYMVLLLILTTVSLSFAMGNDQRNYVLIYAMYTVPLVLILSYPYFSREELPLYLFFVSMLASAALNYDSFRWSTLVYSLLFILTFIYYKRSIYAGNIKALNYVKILRLLIYAFCIVLIIQQICVLMDVPVFNSILADSELTEEGVFRLNSLSPEPSHTAVILTLLMYSYIKMRELQVGGRKYMLIRDGKRDILLWSAFLWPMLTMGSGMAYFLLPVFFLYFVTPRNAVLLSVAFVVVLFIAGRYADLAPIQRVSDFMGALRTGNLDQMYTADHSAAVRVTPNILYFTNYMDIGSRTFWIGYGIDSTSIFSEIVPGVKEDTQLGSIIVSILMNFGFISLCLFIWVLKRYAFERFFSYQALLWFILLFPMGLNTYVVWLSLMLFTTNKYFKLEHSTVSLQPKPAKR